MKLNVKEFSTLLERATAGTLIDNICLRFTPEGRILSNCGADNATAFAIINVQNTVLDKDIDMELNLAKPKDNIVPYLTLFTQVGQEEANFDITPRGDCFTLSENEIICKLHTCVPSKVKEINKKLPKMDFLVSTVITDEIYESYKLVKTANRSGKIYIGIEDNIFYFETGNKMNSATNSFRKNLFVLEHKNYSYYFMEKEVTSLMKLIEKRNDNFTLNICKSEIVNMGYLMITNKEENYFLSSKMDE
jgi:hypothetical protein